MSTHIMPVNAEREFDVSELFFSTTDKRGVITDGNDVFVRVSGHSREELKGRPHNIIRHPDMPRSVFLLLWDYIQNGKSIVAYVKNMAKDGKYYWVMALIIPIEDGYLSIRLKPSSSLFPEVQNIYAELLTLEKSYGASSEERKIGMEATTRRLGEILASRGFESYDSFMQAALVEEMKCRDRMLTSREVQGNKSDRQLGVKPGEDTTLQALRDTARHCSDIQEHFVKVFRELDDYKRLYDKLSGTSEFILDLSRAIGHLSLNATLESARLREAGSCLSVVSTWMRGNSRDIIEAITDLSGQMTAVSDGLKKTSFDIAASRLNIEMMDFFLTGLMVQAKRAGSTSDGNDITDRTNIHRLAEAFAATFQGTAAALSVLHSGLYQLREQLDCVLKLIRTVGFVHVIGKVEAARLRDPSVFVSIFDEVFSLIQDARARLEELMKTLASVKVLSLRTNEIETLLTGLR